jgi:AcrR family transcriptional regulator
MSIVSAAPGERRREAMSQQSRKNTQRARLLDGMVAAANRHGYVGAGVSEVIAEAGVSRPTFYDYFSDREHCFRACIEALGELLLGRVEGALEGAEAREALPVAVGEMVAFAAAEPERARFLTAEALSGGRSALDARDAAVAAIGGAAAARAGDGGGKEVLDIDARVVVGTVFRLLARRLRRGGLSIAGLDERLAEWVRSYARVGERRWSVLKAGPVPPRSRVVPEAPVLRMPELLPRGRRRGTDEETAENHRLRILYAAAQLTSEQGYFDTKVAQITRLAGVDGRVFYRHFADKQEAVSAAHELGFQRVLDVSSQAFFAEEGWPKRSWEAGRALTGLLQENPVLARVGFVEAYAIGAPTVQRIEDSHMAFMFFLQEGLMAGGPEPMPSREAMEAIIDAVFEIVYLQARSTGEPQLAAMLAPIAHIWLTPFLGSAAADQFIDAQLPVRGKPKAGGRS